MSGLGCILFPLSALPCLQIRDVQDGDCVYHIHHGRPTEKARGCERPDTRGANGPMARGITLGPAPLMGNDNNSSAWRQPPPSELTSQIMARGNTGHALVLGTDIVEWDPMKSLKCWSRRRRWWRKTARDADFRSTERRAIDKQVSCCVCR